MNKILFKSISILAIVGTVLTACQEEEIVQNAKERIIPLDSLKITRSLSKKAYKSKYSEVYFMTGEDDTPFNKYKTIKIRDIKGDLCQEWFVEDLHEDWFKPYSYQPGDEKGTLHGYYYHWEGTLSDAQSDWNELVYSDTELEIPAKGFHIPNESDFYKLGAIVGESSAIFRALQLEYDGIHFSGFNDWNNLLAAIWINPIDTIWSQGTDPNQVDGCGIFAAWHNNDPHYGDKMVGHYTNSKTLQCNVRLVRNLTKKQW
ncbi:MAG: hypothetical protein J6T70_16755 [Bacteroidales bacterium]|nr:hypothetical protein [Bacteroidales bacterium]